MTTATKEQTKLTKFEIEQAQAKLAEKRIIDELLARKESPDGIAATMVLSEDPLQEKIRLYASKECMGPEATHTAFFADPKTLKAKMASGYVPVIHEGQYVTNGQDVMCLRDRRLTDAHISEVSRRSGKRDKAADKETRKLTEAMTGEANAFSDELAQVEPITVKSKKGELISEDD